MAGTYDGLGVPLNGAFTRYRANGTTAAWDVSANGAIDYTFADLGADNFISVAITDTTTVSSGYVQAFYSNVNISGSHTSQVNCFATDFTIGGTLGAEAAGMYVYITKSGSPTVTDANVWGYIVNLEDLGACSYRGGFKVYSNSSNVAAAIDSAFYAYCSGASGTFTSLLAVGGSTPPEYFMEIQNAAGRFAVAYSASDSATLALRVNVNGSVYNIPMVPDSCS